jgi:hypothetical protein
LTQTSFKMFYNGTEIIIAGKLDSALTAPFVIDSVISGTQNEERVNFTLTIMDVSPAPIPTGHCGPNLADFGMK